MASDSISSLVAALRAIAYFPFVLMRLILALIVLTLALPAAAMSACHQPSAPVEAHSGHSAPDPMPEREHADALCIGCIAPATVRMPFLVDPLPPTAIDPVAAPTDGAPLGRAPPILRPPRTA